MRGAFVGGVLASMIRHLPVSHFDLAVGVSSGSCSLSYYVTEPTGNPYAGTQFLNVWRHELTGSQLINYLNPLRGKTFLNQEYLIDELFGRKYRLKSERLNGDDVPPFYVVVTNLKTLAPEYIRATAENVLHLLKAATSLPIATRGKRKMGDSIYTDGGIIDPLPVQAVLDAGYRDLTVILTNPRDFRVPSFGRLTSLLAFPGNRGIRRTMRTVYHAQYNSSYDLINDPPEGIDIRIVAPDRMLPAQLIDTDVGLLNDTVDLGISAGHYAFIQKKKSVAERFWRRVKAFLRLKRAA